MFYKSGARKTLPPSVIIFSKIILKFISRILIHEMDLGNEALSDSQTMETKLKWGSTASTSNTLQKYSAHNEELFLSRG